MSLKLDKRIPIFTVYPSGTDMHSKQLIFSFFKLEFKFPHFKNVEPIRALLFFLSFNLAHYVRHWANSNTARILIQVRYIFYHKMAAFIIFYHKMAVFIIFYHKMVTFIIFLLHFAKFRINHHPGIKIRIGPRAFEMGAY